MTQVWASFGGQWIVPGGQKDATKLTARVEVPKDAFGQYELRVATKAGLTNARPISVDDFPEVKGADGNRVKSTPQKVLNPCVVVGQADAEASDFYRVPARAGEPLTLEVFGRRLGSLLDPVILIHDAQGREMAGLYADDTPGLQTDARLTFTPKTTTDYIVEVRDTTYRGGPEYGYRLRVGSYTGATTAFPVAVQPGVRADIRFTGPGTADALPVSLVATAPTATLARPRFKTGGAGWPVPVLTADVPQFAEVEPNNDAASAQKLPLPCGVTGPVRHEERPRLLPLRRRERQEVRRDGRHPPPSTRRPRCWSRCRTRRAAGSASRTRRSPSARPSSRPPPTARSWSSANT